jgi:hypothetical protein
MVIDAGWGDDRSIASQDVDDALLMLYTSLAVNDVQRYDSLIRPCDCQNRSC